MATLNIWDYWTMVANGSEYSGKQGDPDEQAQVAFPLTVTGTIQPGVGVLATATVRTIFDDDADFPADWDYFWIVGDVDFYVQIIGSGSNVILKVEAFIPFKLSFDSMLAAANTTIITGGTEPTLTDIDSIVIGNYSGDDLNYSYTFID